MEDYSHKKTKSGSKLAWIFIIVGTLLVLKQTGWTIEIPGISEFFHAVGNTIRGIFHFAGKIGWPIFLIIAGLLLLAGKRIIGSIVIILLLLFVLPHFIILPGILIFLFFPIILLVVGIVILTKLF